MNNRPPYDLIRIHYEEYTPKILEVSKTKPHAWVSPMSNLFDWNLYFSPIERFMWRSLRYFGKCPLYPQYPVGKYFLDFANPYAKIAVECDGAEYHQDKEKDKKRDLELEKIGWTVFRISGAECNTVVGSFYDDERRQLMDRSNDAQTFYYKTAEGLIKALAVFYFGVRLYEIEDYQENMVTGALTKRCLYQEQMYRAIVKRSLVLF